MKGIGKLVIVSLVLVCVAMVAVPSVAGAEGFQRFARCNVVGLEVMDYKDARRPVPAALRKEYNQCLKEDRATYDDIQKRLDAARKELSRQGAQRSW